jgi:hypothetical protein
VRDRLPGLAARLEAPGTRPAAVAAIVVALLVAAAASFAIAERLKLERSPVAGPRLTRLIGPECECEKAVARLSVMLRERAVVNATIVDGSGEHVATLATGLRRERGRVAFEWDGRDDAGEVVRSGRYRLRLELTNLDRTITVPTPVRVDARPPRVQLVDVSPLVFSPDADGRRDRVLYRYRATEAAYPLVELDEEVLARGRRVPAGPGQVRWRGRLDGGYAEPGTYATRLVVVDAAGNRSEPTRVVTVRVRYVELLDVQQRARIGGTLAFRTDADARVVEYSVRPVGAGEGFGGSVMPGAAEVRVPRGLRPGRYVLRVTVGERGERAAVELVAG